MAGECDPRFRLVEEAFETNLSDGLEMGAACAVVVEGQLVVDLWGGVADDRSQQVWNGDTLVDCRSATKGLTAMCVHLLVDAGVLDLDTPLGRYWPELRCNPTLRQAISHQAGIPILDDLPQGAILDWDVMRGCVERQEPMWAPGERHGYHGASFGWLAGEPVRRVAGEPLASLVAHKLLGPDDGYMGTPSSEHHRIARLVPTPLPAHQAFAPAGEPSVSRDPSWQPELADRMYAPVLPPLAPSMNSAAFRSATIPVTGAAVTARGIARLYGSVAADGGDLLSRSVARDMGEVQVDGIDAVLGVPITRTLGFERTPAWELAFRPAHTFGCPGGGGVVTFADQQAHIGFAYLNNAPWSGAPGADPRAGRLSQAVYACL